MFADQITVTNNIDPDTTWTDSTQIIPKFTTKAQVTFLGLYGDLNVTGYWRTNGQSGTTGHRVIQCYKTGDRSGVTCSVITDSSGIIEFKYDGAGTTTVSIWTNGWYFPKGL